ncbi:MAG: class I SAM-dependent methyltransferase [Candidatus Caldarchaeum sp.]
MTRLRYSNGDEKQERLIDVKLSEGLEDWDFEGADTQYLTHGIHPYPARMIPQIAHRLISRYSHEKNLVVDPFCGSGTVLVESLLLRRKAIGNDINPLAVLIAKVKTTPIEPSRLEKYVSDVLSRLEREIPLLRNGKIIVNSPKFPNIELWFKHNVIIELAFLRKIINDVGDEDVKDLLKICFSRTVRKVSNIYNSGDTFVKRLSQRQLSYHNPNTFEQFKEITIDVTRRVREFWLRLSTDTLNASVNIMSYDARKLPLENETCDLIVTSPPYGEEKNTISYTRWSKLSLLWLGYNPEEILARQKASLGSTIQARSIHSETLSDILEKVQKEDAKLAKNATSFFNDYETSLKEMYRILRHGGFCCIVIGNRSLKRRRVPMDVITKEIGNQIGFEHVATYHRNIPTKATPWVVAKGETIHSENILVFQK